MKVVSALPILPSCPGVDGRRSSSLWLQPLALVSGERHKIRKSRKAKTRNTVRAKQPLTDCSYNVSRHVNDVQAYPIPSPQGASILLYGHENGVTVLWRGGRRFKPSAKKPDSSRNQNGASDDTVMILDSDEDDQPPVKSKTPQRFEDKPEFEDDYEQSTHPEIVQTLDLTLGTSVLHVAVMPATSGASGTEGILSERMVFAVSCVTNDVYLVTLPLTPPSPASKARAELQTGLLAGQAGSGAWGESLVLLGGQKKASDGLAISPAASKSSGAAPSKAIVAACSRQAAGALLLWDVPLDPKQKPDRAVEPFQSEFLPHPLTSISFNPSKKTQLLAVSPYQAVRVYDYAVSSLPPDPETTSPFPAQGSWLLSLYQPFARPSASRKPILGATWISHGGAIFVILADGMWGIWDIDGTRSSSLGAAMSNKLKSGVKGAALTTFSVSGYVEGTSSLRSIAKQQKEIHTGEFAPMTPHTRRQATATLTSASSPDRLSSVRGGVRASILPPRDKTLQAESLVLWVGGLEHVCVIPDVGSFWDSQIRKVDTSGALLFSSGQPSRMIKISDLATGLLGERCCGVAVLVDRSQNGAAKHDRLPVDVMVQGESRVVLVTVADEETGKKVDALVENRRRRLFAKGERTDAIIVHGKPDRATSLSYNLSTSRPGTLKQRTLRNGQNDDTDPNSNVQPSSRPSMGFDFMNTINDAADVSADLTTRDVEAEMLDIMEIDQALASMDGSRRSGR